MEKQLNVWSLSAAGPAKTSPAEIIDRLIKEAFSPCLSRQARSLEYVTGVRALLLQQLVGKPLACQYAEGTAAADAFFSGVEEGRHLHTRHLSSLSPTPPTTVDPFAGLKGHDYIKARNLAPPVTRVQTSAHDAMQTAQEVRK